MVLQSKLISLIGWGLHGIGVASVHPLLIANGFVGKGLYIYIYIYPFMEKNRRAKGHQQRIYMEYVKRPKRPREGEK